MAAQPGIDVLVGRGEQRLELVELWLIQPGEFGRRKGAEDQIDLLEAAPLGPEQKPFAAGLRRATVFHVVHGRGYSLAFAPLRTTAREPYSLADMRPSILFPLFAETRTLAGVGPKLEKLIAKVAGPRLRRSDLRPAGRA